MRKCTFIVLAMLLVCAPLAAQFIGCPDLNSTTGANQNTFPMGAGVEWRYHELIPASCLGAVKFKITDLAFAQGALTSTHPGTYQDFQVRMCLTTLVTLSTTFANHLSNCPITALNAPKFTWAYKSNTWVDLGLKCAFGYDGVRNLLIEIRYRGGASATLFCWRHTYPRTWLAGTGAYNATTGSTATGGLKVRFTVDRMCVMTCTEQVKLGQTGVISVDNAAMGDFYQIATAFGHNTVINLGQCSICLDPDPLFVLSILGLPIFGGYAGQVTVGGKFAGKFAVPNIPQLTGLCLYHAAVTYNKGGVTCCSNTCGTEILP